MGGGISVFDEECARAASNGSICVHIGVYYPRFGTAPIVFHKINYNTLSAIEGFADVALENTLSETGDSCHRDILNVKDKPAARNYARNFIKPPYIFMCCGGQERELSQAEYEDLKNNLCD